jgi:pimeloyl-ACP methyl ester carboxylesterase
MPSAAANGIIVEYEVAGDPGDPPMLLIMGLASQLTAWDDDFVAALVERGFYVIRFDNRDVGLSTWFDQAGTPDLMAVLGGKGRPPYSLSDMAADAAGLLDALAIDSAHVVGVSMGGMIAQSLLIDHPKRVRSLVSIMSTTGDPAVGQPSPEAVTALLRPPAADREAAMAHAVDAWRVIGSPGFAFDEARTRARAGAEFDRAFHPAGAARQVAAILCSGDRTAALGAVECPALVIHGESDPLVDPSGGCATAAALRGSELKLVPGMGHDLPHEIFGEIADAIAAHAHPHDT